MLTLKFPNELSYDYRHADELEKCKARTEQVTIELIQLVQEKLKVSRYDANIWLDFCEFLGRFSDGEPYDYHVVLETLNAWLSQGGYCLKKNTDGGVMWKEPQKIYAYADFIVITPALNFKTDVMYDYVKNFES